MVLVEAIWIFAVATVGGPTTRLHVGDAVRLGTEHAKECFRVHRAGADFDVVWLLKNAVAIGPEFLQLKDEILKSGPFAAFDFTLDFNSIPLSPDSKSFSGDQLLFNMMLQNI